MKKYWSVFALLIVSFTSNGATLNTDRLSIQSDKDVAKVCLEDYAKNLTSNNEPIKGEVYVYRITYRGNKYAFDMSIAGQTSDAHGYPKLVNIPSHTKTCNIKSSQMEHYRTIEENKSALIKKKKEIKKAQNKLDNLCIAEFESALVASPEMNQKFIRGAHKNSIRETNKLGNVLDVSVYWNYDGAVLNDEHMNVYVSCTKNGQYTSHKLSPSDLEKKEKAQLTKEKNAQQQKERDKLAKELKASKEQDMLIAKQLKDKKANELKSFTDKYSAFAKQCVLDDAGRVIKSLMNSLPSSHRPEAFYVEKQQAQTMKVSGKYISVAYRFWLHEQKKFRGKLQEKEIVSYSIKKVDGIKVAAYRWSTATAKCLLPN